MNPPRPRRLLVILIAATGLAASGGGRPVLGQTTLPADKNPKASIAVRVHGEIAKPLDLTAADLAGLKRQTVTVQTRDKTEVKYEGVSLHDVLQKAAIPAGNDLRSKSVSHYLIVEAADGYAALFALPELDPAYTDRTILLADRLDGKPLSDRDGPYQVIVPGEKRHARWVKRVVGLRLGKDH